MLSALSEPRVSPDFELTTCEKAVVEAITLIDQHKYTQAKDVLMEGMRTELDCISALLLMRFLRLDVIYIFGQTDISAEDMLSRAQKASQEKRDRAKLFRNYLAEALPSSPNALFLCGSITEKIFDDIKASLPYYTRSAELGSAAAQFNIGCFYNTGYVVDLDKEEAARWFKLAADQGRLNAMNNLGVLYLTGQGVPQDRKKAAELFKAASEHGHTAARKNYLLAIKPQTGLKIPTAGSNITDAPIVSPRDNFEPWDPSENTEDVPLTGSSSRKRRWSFSTRFFGEK